MRSSPPENAADVQEPWERGVSVPSRAPRSLPLSALHLAIVCASVIVGLLILVPAGIVIVQAAATLAHLAPILVVAFVLFLLCLMVIGQNARVWGRETLPQTPGDADADLRAGPRNPELPGLLER